MLFNPHTNKQTGVRYECELWTCFNASCQHCPTPHEIIKLRN